MKICAFQPKYPYEESEKKEHIRFLLETLDRCDPSMDLIVLPECCNTPGEYGSLEAFRKAVRENTSVLTEKARETAVRCNALVAINMYAGDPEHPQNSTLLFDRSGKLRYTYRKQHLPYYEEFGKELDAAYTYQYSPVDVAEIDGIRYGFLTCYDAYFNEFIANMARCHLDVILYPSYQRGETEHILKMEAENIAFNCNAWVIRSSVSMGEGCGCGAQTMVVEPDGRVLGCLGQEEGTLVCNIDPKKKHMRANSYGHEEILAQDFVEKRRRPWAYRPAGPAMIPGDADLPYPRICAHRGFNSFAPENTMAAFSAAVGLGAPEIELDVWFSKDHVPVVCHDASVDRTSNGTGNIRDLTWEEIRRLDIGGKVNPRLAGMGFPRFDEVLKKLARQVIMNLHIKSVGVVEEYDHSDFQRLLNLIDEYDCRDHVYIAGEEDVMRTSIKLAPDMPRCLLDRYQDFGLVKLAKTFGCAKVQLCKAHPNGKPSKDGYYFDQAMIDEAKEAGMHCNLYWSNDPEETRRMLDMGVDTILTDRYLEIAQVAEAWKKERKH